MTITGRFPVWARAEAKMCSRSGVRRAEMHALETIERRIRVKIKNRGRAGPGLFNGHRPATIDQTRDKAGAKTVVDVYDSDV